MAQTETKVVKDKDVTIVRSSDTRQIILPQGMALKEAAKWLEKKDKEEEKEVQLNIELNCFPLDGAVAFRKALTEIYGFVSNVDTPGWFGPEPPTFINVPVSINESLSVPWGRVKIPGIDGYLETSMRGAPTPKFVLAGLVKQRDMFKIEELTAKISEILATDSIYKGKAIMLDLEWLRENKRFNPTGNAPQFTIEVDKIRPEELIFPANVEEDIQLGLFTPIEQTQHCRDHQIPLKRGVLLAGDYGTGKTLTAYVTAKKAVENGWTFIYLKNVLDLAQGFRFAAQYAPAVIFAEDVDRVAGVSAADERSEEIDAVLNSFDGVESKRLELITVLTTNHLDRLTQAILRPGRCDLLVQVTRPDAAAAIRLVKLYGRDLIAADAKYDIIGAALNNHLPAEIREAVERAKLAAVSRMARSGQLQPGGSIAGHVTEIDLLAAIRAMNNQHKLLEVKEVDKRGVAEKCADILGNSIGKAVAEGVDRNTATVVSLLSKGFGHNPQELELASNVVGGSNDENDEDDDEN